jgi:hypothetical protein
MESIKEITIMPGPWAESVGALLAQSGASIPDLRHQVTTGTAQLFTVQEGEIVIAAYVLRIDTLATGPQGVIVAAAGRGKGVNLTESILPVIEGQFKGCASVRLHTARPGLARRVIQDHGYRITELVLEKEL